ncbi:MAG: energy transducer TonB [Thermodesulfobacteriota bacterium]
MVFSKNISTSRFPLAFILSIFFHMAIILILSLTPWPTPLKAISRAYLVNWVPPPPVEREIPKPSTPSKKEEISKPKEEMKPLHKPKKNEIIEKIKKKEKEESLKQLQEALEEIRKKAALEELQKKIVKREAPPIQPSPPPPSPSLSSSPTPTPSPSPPAVSPSLLEAKLNEYYTLLWAKIKESWTLPENILKERVDLETIIVVIIDRNGKIQKSWFEKESGHTLYDQMAMRAIKKAEPFPPFPKEWNESTLEIGIRFYPE